jgi:TolB-like protein
VTKAEYDKAVEVAERGVSMDPNSVTAVYLYASTLMHASRCEEAIPVFEKAIRLSPLKPPLQCLVNLSSCYAYTYRYDEAVTLLKRVLQEQPNSFFANIGLTRVYAELDRLEDARAQAAHVLRLNPKFSLESFVKTWRVKDPAAIERYVSALRKAGLPEKPPLPLPDKPSIAVLPFVNMSDDPQQEYFSDGMTEDLITDLSKISGLFVLARNSTFVYKGKPVNIQQVSRELGVKYVLEGSVRRAGDQVRINAQLIDATTGQHLWAERYDGSMRDVFSLQDKINQKIVAALAVKLTVGEKELLTQKGTDDPAAYEEFLKGREHYLKTTKEDYAKAEACFKKAIELDPNFARAKASLALLYFDAASQGTKMREAFGMSMVEVRLRARHYLIEAMKKPNSITYQVAGLMDLNLRQWDAAISHLEKALALDPNDSLCHGHMSWVLSMAGKPAEGIEYAKNGMRLDPLNPGRHLVRIGLAHFCMDEWQQAVTAIGKALKLNPELVLFGTILGSAYSHLGRDTEAKAAYHAYFERPPFDLFLWPFRDRRVSDSFLEGLQKAGVPAIRIEWSRIYQVSTEDQLTGSDLKAFYYPSKTTGYAQGGMDWTLDIAKDGTAIFEERTLPGGKDTGKSWLKDDRLWLQFQEYYSGKAYCNTIFRNPKGTPEGKNEYISFNDVWPTRFSRIR